MTVAEYIADQLSKKGVRYVFGIPGGPSIPYIEALRRSGIEFVLTANEAAAGIMADVTARLTGVTGICHSTFGPGATNLTTGIGGALLDRSPVLAFTSEISDSMIRRTTQMNIDHQQLMKPVSKASFRMTPENAAEVLESAFRISSEEYPGPVHIGLPSDIAGKEITLLSSAFNEPEELFKNDITGIGDLLSKSRKPLLAVGLTYARLQGEERLKGFLEKFMMPVVLTPMAKGVLDEEHPCYAGVLFHSLSDYLEDIYKDSDLIIGLGYDPVEYNYESWIPEIPVVHFGTRETDHPEHKDIRQYVGPPEEWFQILENNLQPGSIIFSRSAVQAVRDEILAVLNGFTGHFGPVTVLKVLREELPSDAVVTADVGSHLHLAGQMWMTGGMKNLIITNGWSGMGFGLPAALAARLARPEPPVVCITGDGGFLMMAGEIITARRQNLPVVIVVLSDGELNLIKLKQTWQNITPYSTKLYSGDLFESDMFLGITVFNAESEESMRNAIKESITLNRPVIINAIIESDDYNWLVVRKPAQ